MRRFAGHLRNRHDILSSHYAIPRQGVDTSHGRGGALSMEPFYNPFFGRITRSEWWLAQVAIWVFVFLAMVLSIMLFADEWKPGGQRNATESALFALIVCSMFYMNFATNLNRLRDGGHSGWLYLTFFAPFAGSGLMLYFCGVAPSRVRDAGRAHTAWNN